MKREKELLKNTIIISIGKICTQLINFFLLPLYTALLTTSEYGIVDLLNTLVALLLPIVTFQIEQAIFRNLIEARENEEEKKNLISSTLFSVIIQCFFFLIISLFIVKFLHNEYKYFLIVNVITSIFSSLLLQISRGLGKNKNYAIAGFIIATSTILFNLYLILIMNLKVTGILLGTLLGQIIGSLYLVITLNLWKYINIKNAKISITKKLWLYSLPLIPNAISWWIFNASDRVIVSYFLSLSENGILSAASKFSAMYIAAYGIFNMSWTESISVNINDKDINNYFNKTFDLILKFFLAIAIGLISSMPFIYPIMINSKFASGYYLVPILIMASLFNVVVGLISVIYVAKKNTKAIANTSIISATTNIIVHLCLIKYIGLYAAVISTFVAYFTMSIYRLYDINKRYFKIIIEKELYIKGIIFFVIILTLYYFNNFYTNLLLPIIAVIAIWSTNRKSFKTIIKLVKEKIIKK